MVKVVATVMLAAGVAASRNEGTVLLQGLSMSRESQGEERNAQLVTMKEQVLAFAQGGVPQASKPFLQEIEQLLTKQILTDILKEKTATQESEKNDLKPFTQAETDYTTAMTPLRDGGADLEAVNLAKGTHTECRGLESTDKNESVVCHGEKDVKQGTLNRGVNALHDTTGTAGVCEPSNGWHQMDIMSLGDYVLDVKIVLDDRKALDAQIATCQRLDGELETQKGTCDGNQATYETLACTRAQDSENAAAEYKRAYKVAKETIQANWKIWQVQSGDRIKQCQLVNTIVCYVEALEQNDDKADLESAIATCDGETHDCSAYAFTASALPQEIGLDAVPAAPCQDGFDYGVFPEGTAQATCKACALAGESTDTGDKSTDTGDKSTDTGDKSTDTGDKSTDTCPESHPHSYFEKRACCSGVPRDDGHCGKAWIWCDGTNDSTGPQEEGTCGDAGDKSTDGSKAANAVDLVGVAVETAACAAVEAGTSFTSTKTWVMDAEFSVWGCSSPAHAILGNIWPAFDTFEECLTCCEAAGANAAHYKDNGCVCRNCDENEIAAGPGTTVHEGYVAAHLV